MSYVLRINHLHAIFVRIDFRQSLTAAKPPAELTLALVGLWWDAKGDWTRAHESAQQDEGPEGSWVHAYLHRKEGYQGNAAYWYGRSRDHGSLFRGGSSGDEAWNIRLQQGRLGSILA